VGPQGGAGGPQGGAGRPEGADVWPQGGARGHQGGAGGLIFLFITVFNAYLILIPPLKKYIDTWNHPISVT
jgi:hypothetical protein